MVSESDLGHGNVEVLDLRNGGGAWDGYGMLVAWIERAEMVDALLV